jgi:hypothetical protein
MAVRAVFKIAEHALTDFHSGSSEPTLMLTALAVRPSCHVSCGCMPCAGAAVYDAAAVVAEHA